MTLADLMRQFGAQQTAPSRYRVVGQGPKDLYGEALSAAFGGNPRAVRASSWAQAFGHPQEQPYAPPAYRPFRADPLPRHFGNDWGGMNQALLQRHPTLSGLLNYRPPSQQLQPLVSYGPAMGRRG